MEQLLLSLMIILSTTTAQAADAGVSVSIGQPGFYGRIDIGDFPPPQLINARPVVIIPPRRTGVQEPIYLRVPPGHAKRWKQYCSRYDACGRPVHFVQDRWYRDVYVPQYRQRHDRGPDRGRDRHGNYSRGPDRAKGPDRDRRPDRD